MSVDKRVRRRLRLAAAVRVGKGARILPWRQGRSPDSPSRQIQVPACDRCALGVMDATNSHLLGICECDCHA